MSRARKEHCDQTTKRGSRIISSPYKWSRLLHMSLIAALLFAESLFKGEIVKEFN